jgi:hypothetical protein
MNNSKFSSPGLARWTLKRVIIAGNRDVVLGDFEELYREILQKRGRSQALLWYWAQVFLSIPPFFKSLFIWSFIMFKNYLKVALRNIIKHKGYSFISISGLTLGMVCCIFIFLWVQDELNFDRFHKNADNIYRVIVKYPGGNKDPLGKILRYRNNYDLTVTGIIENVDSNSHLGFDFVVPIQIIGEQTLRTWAWDNTSYLLLQENADLDGFRKKIAGIIMKEDKRSTTKTRVDIPPCFFRHSNPLIF